MDNYWFRSNRLGFRRWGDTDLTKFLLINQDPAVLEFLPGPLSENETSEMIQRIERHFDDYGYGLFAVDELDSGTFIGFIGFQNTRFDSWFTPAVEIGYRLESSSWGKGYATEGAKCCLDWYFEKGMGAEIVSFTSVLNHRSERVMQKIGMSKIGEFDHPSMKPDHRLNRHVLYSIMNEEQTDVGMS